ncbi:alpha/beta-hydrolase [Aspergillus japonicus CBS 114.51]|uniref:Alpha/beta-hydrolase n=1 Tax=Aspergillus japonicus CBS 114.51 TaxID=1448312 RepID=A0A8T8X7V9_ASPJA|nr:alpha/beta-hydrolase [Aspergillus japonicus CBS 114.51]RAH84253.1 alpha/beta-hydrolase [Aspergillus japonicus CBS 114.51]
MLPDVSETLLDEENHLIFEKNVSVPLKNGGLVRCNVYRPIEEGQYPCLVTYGPYGKDIPYEKFHPKSFSEVNPAHKSKYSAWETPDPVFWTHHQYIVIRADEQGLGQSPGTLNTMSAETAAGFAQVVEWAAEQPWSTGKVGLVGVSYYAGTQWRVAALKPKGLACIIPHEGMSDYYRDRCRHGGILSNRFISFWWNRQVITNQYGRPDRAAAEWGDDPIDGALSEADRLHNLCDQNTDNAANRYLDDEYYASTVFRLEDIEVPVLSVANWGGISLHLRGNVEGYTWAGAGRKWLRFIVGRHDLPFYYDEEVKVQHSFLEAFLRDNDYAGWMAGKVAPVSLTLRRGDVGFNNPVGERAFPRREEMEWPLARTVYTRYYLTPGGGLDEKYAPAAEEAASRLTYAVDSSGASDTAMKLQFSTAPAPAELEVTGHIVAHLCVSVDCGSTPPPSDLELDVFATLRHFSAAGNEVHYTGSSGDAVPVTKGWLRVSLRKTNPESPYHRPYLPRREYRSVDVLPVKAGEIYACDVELWPTNVVVEKGGRLVFEVSANDTEGSGLFQHNSEVDRPPAKFGQTNAIHFGEGQENCLVLPVIPAEGA